MDEVTHFCNLFDEVFNTVNNGQVTAEEIEIKIEEAISRFRGGPTGACDVKEGESLAYTLAFYRRFSPLSAGVTRYKTLLALEKCEEFRKRFCQPTLKIVNVGGGAGSDLVGLYSALYGYSGFQDMNVLLIDNNINWEPFFQQVNIALREGKFGNASLLMQEKSVFTSFERTELRNDLPDNLQKNLGDADLIFIKGLWSILDDFGIRKITENIVSAITEKGMLVVMDSPHYLSCFESCMGDMEAVFSTEQKGNYLLGPIHEQENRNQFATSTKFELRIYKKKAQDSALNNQKN